MPWLIALAPKIIDIVAGVIDKTVDDPKKADELKQKASEQVFGVLQTSDQNQSATNQIEAASNDPFKSRWRPATGWVCVAGLFYQFLLRPFMIYTADLLYAFNAIAVKIPNPPSLDDVLMELLFALLGLSAVRTVERLKGKA
jgi:hypothetical protein